MKAAPLPILAKHIAKNVNNVYVFASDLTGVHTDSLAKQFGARSSELGLMRQSFAIPVKDKDGVDLSAIELDKWIWRFCQQAVLHPEKNFIVSDIVRDTTHSIASVAKAFSFCVILRNVYLPEDYINSMKHV